MTDQPQDAITENPLDYVRTYQFHPCGSYYVLLADHLSEIARLRTYLHEIAHDHGWQATALASGSTSLAIGFAQGIAREALGERQNEWTEEAMRLRSEAKSRRDAARREWAKEVERG